MAVQRVIAPNGKTVKNADQIQCGGLKTTGTTLTIDAANASASTLTMQNSGAGDLTVNVLGAFQINSVPLDLSSNTDGYVLTYNSVGTKMELQAVPGSVGDKNASSQDYMLQANMVYNLMMEHVESMFLEDDLKNGRVDFFSDLTKISSSSQVAVDGYALQLDSTGTSNQSVDVMDSTANWPEISGGSFRDAKGQINTETGGGKQFDGTSLEMDIGTDLLVGEKYGAERTFASAEDWTTTTQLKCYHSADHTYVDRAIKWGFRLRNTAGTEWYSSLVNIVKADGDPPDQYTFDISGCPFLDDIKYIGVYGEAQSTAKTKIYIDVLTREQKVFYTSGNANSITLATTDTDVTDIFFLPYVANTTNTSITYKISLDGGTTWHTIVGGEENVWVAISGWVESFTNKRNIKVRLELATSDTADTPYVDDYLIMWKVA